MIIHVVLRCKVLTNFWLHKTYNFIHAIYSSNLMSLSALGTIWSKKTHFIKRNHNRIGRSYEVASEQIREADHILQDDDLGLNGKNLTWNQLAVKMNADVIDRTTRNIMQAVLNYAKCLTCVKVWLTDAPMNRRVEWITVMLIKYLNNEHWNRVRFNNKVNFSRRLKSKLRIICQFDTRYWWDCI